MSLKTIFDNGTHKIEIDSSATLSSEAPPIRIISIGALDERLTFDESDLIDNSNNKHVKVLNKRLGRKAYIDLDSPAFADALDLLIVANCIAPERKADLMVDGVEIEKYNGPL